MEDPTNETFPNVNSQLEFNEEVEATSEVTNKFSVVMS